ncbi:SH3 domain-containing C40 family peptidase [Gemmatimonas aurantiaca]|uniref:C40 family peptidase n=1 Tax=Gemmatimonas aurantiaca TaxID=173480 RepID=UPI00301DE9D8
MNAPDIRPSRTVRAAVAPLLGEPRIAHALTSQLLAGEIVTILDERGDWVQVRGPDDYAGWTHAGYLSAVRGDEASWPWSLGCETGERHNTRDEAGRMRALPLGARFAPEQDVIAGAWVRAADLPSMFPPDRSMIAATAASFFRGASYLWGGVTPWGVDCSGLVQRAARLHGVRLPRDAWQQADATDPVSMDALANHEPSDLLFFSDRDDRRITHVGLALGDGRMVHSALTRGGVAVEHLDADDPYVVRLRAQCVGVHRLRTP